MSGAARLDERVTVSKDMSPLEIQLQVGSDVHFELVRSDRERRGRCALLKESRKMELKDYLDMAVMTFRSLPCGNYVLHVPSSAEVKLQNGRFGYAPARIAYAGRDMPFVIRPDSSVVIDLGTINLDAANK